MSQGAKRGERSRGALGSARHPGARRRRGAWRRELWEQLKELSRPLLIYWAFVITMFGAFAVAVVVEQGPDLDNLSALGTLGFVTVVCVFAGQVFALLRVRDWTLFLLWVVTWTLGSVLGCLGVATIGAAFPPLAYLVMWFVFLGPLFILGGAWSLRTGRALFATWVPLIYATGTAIIFAEGEGKVAGWEEGSKWAVWNVFTFGVLGLAIAFLLAFLVAREGHRLYLWRRSKRGMLRGTVTERGAARPRLSCLGWVMLGVLAGGLAVGTALVGPYLWRTGDTDRDGVEHDGSDRGDPQQHADNQGDQQQEGTPEDGRRGKPEPCEGTIRECMKQRAQRAAQQVQENMQPTSQQGVDLLSTLLTLLILMLLALLVGYRPVKRLLLVRHLRRPFWTIPPTGRIEQGWRLVEIALGDAGAPPRMGEPAVSLWRRAAPRLDALTSSAREVHGLSEAAAIRDRVAYGLVVGPDDVLLMEQVAAWAYDTVWDRLGDKGQLKAMYRGL